MAAWQKGGAAKGAAANGAAKETPHLTVSTQSKKAEVGIQTLIGDYIERGTNHGKKYYQKVQKIEGHEDIKVFLYYWDNRDGADFSGWWFGDQLGGSQVWARSPSHTPTPPRIGWKIPWDAVKADLGALFVDPYKPGASAAASAVAAAAAAAAAAAPASAATAGGKVQNQTIPPPNRAGAAQPAGAVNRAAQPGGAAAAGAASTAERVRKATEQVDGAEAAANEALTQAKELIAGQADEDILKQVQELLQKQLAMLMELPKSLMADINEVKKSGWAGNSAVSDLSKLIPKARALQARLTAEITRVTSQVQKAQQVAAAAKKKVELEEQKKKAGEKDAKDLAENLPPVQELVTQTEEAIAEITAMADPLIAQQLDEKSETLKSAMDEIEKASNETQNKIIEARKQTNVKLQAAKRYVPDVQKSATTEYQTLQQKLTEAQKKLNPYKTFRQSYKARVEAKKALTEMTEKMDAAELEVEKASLMSSAAEHSQMSEDEVGSAEKLVSPATMAISNALRNIELKLRTSDGAVKEELTQIKERGLAAKRKIEAVSQVLRRQREGLGLQQMLVAGSERVESAEEALTKCHEAEMPFLKGLEVLPPEESTKAIAACEEAAKKADSTITAAKVYCKTKLQECSKKPKEVAKGPGEELQTLLERAEAAHKKLVTFKGETLDRKTAARLKDVMDAISEAEAKVNALATTCEVFHSENLDNVSTDVLQDSVDRAGAAEKAASEACAEAKKLLESKKKDAKGDLVGAVTKLQGKLNTATTEVIKQKQASQVGVRLIKGKAVLIEEEERIRQAEFEVEKVQKVISKSADGEELSDDAVREMGDAVVSSQKALKSTMTCLNSHLPGSVPAVKASLQKLVDRTKKAQEKLNSVLAATKDQRERVLAQAYVKEGERKAEEVEEAMERVNKAELPFLKGLEFLPVSEATETIKESEAAAAAVQAAIGEARTYIASKNLEVKQFKEDASKPASEEFAKQSERINASAAKLSLFRKDTEGRKKTAQMQEAAEKINTIESEGKTLAEAIEPFTKGEVDEMSVEDAYELCTKLLAQFKELYGKMDEARIFIAARQKDAKGTSSQIETLQKLQSRLSDARVEVAKSKMAVSDREQKISSKKLLAEASEMVLRLEEEVQKAAEFCAPLLEKGGEAFLVAGSEQTLAAALRDHMGEKDLSIEALFKQIDGEAAGKVPQEAFLAWLEALPSTLKKEELTFTEERRLAIFKHLDSENEGAVGLASFEKMFTTRYVCVKGISVTDQFEVQESKTTSKIEPDDVMEALGNPKVEEATGMTRVEVKIISTEATGFVTMVGNGGTVYIETVSPFKTFAEEMDKKLEETVKSANQVSIFFKTKSAELASAVAPGKAGGAMSDARQELVKLRLKMTGSTTNLESTKKKAAMAKKDYPKREQLDRDAHIEIREKKAAAAIQTDISAKVEAMEASLKRLEEAVAPLLTLKGAERDAFATPASLLKEAEGLSSAAAQSVSDSRKLREEQLAKVGKAIRGPFVDIKRELQKMELKAAATQKKCTSLVESVRGACHAIVDACQGQAAAALREEVQRRGVTNEALFAELLKPGEERISDEALCQHLQSLEGLSLKPEHALLIARHIEADGIGRRKFLAFVQQYYCVVKAIAITDILDVSSAKILRTLDLDEVIEVVEGPVFHEKLGLTRIRGRSIADNTEGWVSVKGNQGTPFLVKVLKPHFCVTKEVRLERDFKNEGDEAIRTLEVEEVVELIEGPRKDTFPPGLRVRAKAVKDGAVGWVTIKDKKGVKFAEEDTKYYNCTTSVAMTDEQDIKTCSVLRKLEKGEMFLALADPVLDEGAGITRVHGKAVKDGKLGWITIKGNAGTIYADANNKHFTVLREAPMHKTFTTAKAQTVRLLEEGEALQGLEAPKEETYPPEVRLKGRALSDDAVGWVTKADNVRPWSPYYKCVEATPLHSSRSPEGAEAVRQLEVGEALELLEGPCPEGKEMRMKGRAEKDRAVGWVTIRNAEGKKLLES